MRRIAIIVHEHDDFGKTDYFLRPIADVWREQGDEVVLVRGAASAVDADLAVAHVDITVTPPEYRAVFERYPVVLNGRVTDIAKRHISRQIVRRGDGYSGPVLVKTDNNCAGGRETYHARHEGWWRHRLLSARNRLPWVWRSRLKTYPIFDSPARVPAAVWRNPDLVVERFLPERHGDEYALRVWMFLGDRESNAICYSPVPIVKGRNVTRKEPGPDVPDELRRLRAELGFDYGKFDYALVDGRVVLYDANRTPAGVGGFSPEQADARARLLAGGVEAFFGRTAAPAA